MKINTTSKTLLHNRKLLLWGDINERNSYGIIKNLKLLYLKNQELPIKIYIHTDGGEVECGMAIVDEIRGIIDCGGEVWTIAQGKAYSMGAIILASGSQRYATPNSSIMFHSFWQSTATDEISQIKKSADFTHKYQENVLKQVAKFCGFKPTSLKKFQEDVSKTLWLTSTEAKKYGIIDDVWKYEWESDTQENQKGN